MVLSHSQQIYHCPSMRGWRARGNNDHDRIHVRLSRRYRNIIFYAYIMQKYRCTKIGRTVTRTMMTEGRWW